MKSLKDTLAKKREMSLAEKEALADKIHQTVEAGSTKKDIKALHRLTLDLPTWLVDKMKIETERNGQTMKGYILNILLQKFSD
jgi:hypothetical protein